MALKLIIGNKNYSSWSMRPWIAMKVANIPFEETVISLNAPDFKKIVGAASGTGKVPVLIDGDCRIWESLAILEYVAEKFPDAKLWPSETHARAHARVVATEMHSGFQALRKSCPMNFWLPVKSRPQPSDVMDNVRRIESIWTDCRRRFGQGGRFLFGVFSAADAMYAPVVSRLHSYGLDVGEVSRAYMDTVMALPAWAEWRAAALKETWILKEDEPEWPLVRGVALE
jgi:glutathione S-transferase